MHMYMYGKVHYRNTLLVCYFSITVQGICMKFGVVIEPNSACFILLLGDWSSSSFGVENVLVSTFVHPFKSTANKKL